MNGLRGTCLALARREFQEHRWLWLAPLIVVGLLVGLTIFGAVAQSSQVGGFRPWPRVNSSGISAMQIALMAFSSPLFFVSSLVGGFYLLDCLYAERKDRSILFWKSLPVSDFATVLSKFGVAMLIVPLGTFVLVTLAFPVIYAINAAGLPGFREMTGGWSFGAWLSAEGVVLARLLVTMLWYAPLAAWLMLASVISSRSPQFLAILPVVVLTVCERLLLESNQLLRYIVSRTLPVMDVSGGLQRPGLWIGLAAAAGMLYIVIRLRRYRDDT